jgi:hypothetical protein
MQLFPFTLIAKKPQRICGEGPLPELEIRVPEAVSATLGV